MVNETPETGSGFAGRRRKRTVGGARKHRTVIKHTDEEWARVQSHAAFFGVTVPAFYERQAFAGSAQNSVALEEAVLGMLGSRRLLANAANNLNQITHAVNSGDALEPGRLDATLRLFERAIADLKERIDELDMFVPRQRDADMSGYEE